MSGIGGGVLHILYEQVEDKRIWNVCIYVLFTYWLGQKQEQTNSALFTCTLDVCEEPEGFILCVHMHILHKSSLPLCSF